MVEVYSFEDFLGEEVVDRDGNKVGSFACYWEREDNKPLLLGVDIPERSGHTHVVPARCARANGRQSYIQLIFSQAKIRNAPCLPCDCEPDDEFEQKVFAYYGIESPGTQSLSGMTESETARAQLRRIVRSNSRRKSN